MFSAKRLGFIDFHFSVVFHRFLWRGGYPPDDVPNVIRHQQRTTFVEGNTHGASQCIAIFKEEACQNFHGVSEWQSIAKWYEDHLIAVRYLTIP
jgi:hypothetical protein